ncbi:hypothetical protein [Paraburkholderia bannensis]|uniref:hypothetical protein n=1 Tax=Paraburkholderia bannensis TaxID=765414 RepID=UPI002AAF927F|nr:hypothetical protein [Paraburkholderia bannensis]
MVDNPSGVDEMPVILERRTSRSILDDFMLKIYFRSDFKWQDTVLINGSENELSELRYVLVGWRGERSSLINSLRSRVSLILDGISDLTLELANDEEIRGVFNNHGTIVWLLSLTQRDRIVGLLDSLRHDEAPCHQYLETGGTAQILCARDEYM